MTRLFQITTFLVASSLLLSMATTSVFADEAKWDEALSRTYIHGIDEKLANEEIGAAGVPYLLTQLDNPDQQRRDNVVAFLGWLGDAQTVDALVQFLEDPPAGLDRVEEDKAALLAPLALGDIARRKGTGHRKARKKLLSFTQDGKDGLILQQAGARRSSNAQQYRDDLLEQVVYGLARSGKSSALKRLQSISKGGIIPARGSRDLRPTAKNAIKRYKKLFSPDSRRGSSSTSIASHDHENHEDSTEALQSLHYQVSALSDSSDTFHSLGLTFANHVDHTNPITDSRVDQILASVSQRVQTEDFAEDTACCLAFARAGTAQSFGSPNDGLDVLDTDTETRAAMDDTSAHVKIVRAINACGGTISTNIIGCGWIGRAGFVVERRSDVGQEGALWAHENGHNAGINHNSNNTDWIMFGSLGSNNRALLAAECTQFHNTSTGGQKTAVGPCCSGELCAAGCGNNFKESGEDCDGTDLGGESCSSIGFDGGSLSCNGDCTFATGNCSTCGNGIVEDGEECDGAQLQGASCSDSGCLSGTPSCSSSCTIDYGSCLGCPVCDQDGICEADENCNDCSDCLKSSGEASCGNGVCDAYAGEDCSNCPSDCNGKQNGKPDKRYCCGAGGGENPIGCGDSRCNEGVYSCANAPLPSSCCNDGSCSGVEDSFNCAIDCGAPPSCRVAGEACTNGGDCCSNRCKGPKNNKTCT